MSGRRAFRSSAAVIALAALPAIALGSPVCGISNATSLAFGTISDPDGPQDARASFVVTCTRTQTTTISLVYSHRLNGGAGGRELTYDLYSSANHAAVWGSGGDGAPIEQTFAAGRPTTVYVYARIPPHQQAVAGRFDDSIEIVTMP